MTAVPKPPRRSPSKRKPVKRVAVKKRNPARRKSEFVRTYGSKERVEFVKWLRCSLCRNLPCENHHIENGGAGRKASFTKILPLCWNCHRAWHNRGRKGVEEFFPNKDFDALAADTERAWQKHLAEKA